ncbi:MAG: DUF1800 domain-containing protein [Ideonella sp.]
MIRSLVSGLMGRCLLLSACVALAAPLNALAAADEAQALHVLNRISFGPAPGDLQHVQQIGIDAYIDEQLHPQRLPLPLALSERLDALPTTRWPVHELVTRFRAAAATARRDVEAGKAERRDLYRQVALETGEARLLRAVESPQQLQEVMVDFWFNHFNVFSGKGMDRVLVGNYEQEAIRPYALGNFRDLLGATAKHPAMLFYLDNWLSEAPGLRPGRGKGAQAKAVGLNENYARELMELHTLGVDGGYTQQDVTELARMLTGWTMRPGAARGDSLFQFDERRHDQGEKTWLGQRVVQHGQAEGEWALDRLAEHPATAHHIAFQLAQYFVDDEPPPALVDRVAKRFSDSHGNIAAVLKTLFESAEFRDPSVRSAKFKTPYRYVVSSLRAAGQPVGNVQPLLGTLAGLGMPLYGCQTPDGYKHTEQAWLNPEAMTRRIGFAIAFTTGRLPLARAADAEMTGGAMRPMLESASYRPSNPSTDGATEVALSVPPIEAGPLLANLGPMISAKTRTSVAQADPGLRAALVIGSPDFMRH